VIGIRLPIRSVARWLAVIFTLTVLHSTLVAAHQGQPGSWIELCTPQGVRWIKTAGTMPDEGEALADLRLDESSALSGGMTHCPLCRVLADLPPSFLRVDLSFSVPPFVPQAPPPEVPPQKTAEPAASSAPPRAPPSRSA
jgi:hypothetical protein